MKHLFPVSLLMLSGCLAFGAIASAQQPNHDQLGNPGASQDKGERKASDNKDNVRDKMPAKASDAPRATLKKGRKIANADWQRGSRVDYRSHKLSKPPKGYEWRKVDNNYVQVVVATGVISSIVAAH